ncbi:MAG: hypothetical protein QXN87_08640 [Candidatus Bathyarchaeia archaeon]
MVFQILNFENQASFRGKLGYKAENRESGENNGFLASENLWKNFTPNCRVAETPFKVDSSFSTEKSQKHFGFSDIPREKRLFL